MRQQTNFTAVDHAGTGPSTAGCEMGRRIKLDSDYMGLLWSHIAAWDGIAECAQREGGERWALCSRNPKRNAEWV